jgi:hypothetical protein
MILAFKETGASVSVIINDALIWVYANAGTLTFQYTEKNVSVIFETVEQCQKAYDMTLNFLATWKNVINVPAP